MNTGGNWGDYWSYDNIHVQRLRAFVDLLEKGWTVVQMTQSMYYVNTGTEKNDTAKWIRDINQRKVPGSDSKDKIHLNWRQEDSFNKANSLYPFVTNHLLPDVAFMIGQALFLCTLF